MEQKVKKIFADYLGVDKEDIRLDMGLVEDLNINSYDIMSIVAIFEEEFKCEIPDRDIRYFNKVKDVLEYIKKKGL